ncbi:hypothetical protein A3I36_00305 [Candidatus Giovannonibacteria bacterium RIFCSPLOWO2_02_FULL_45_28]|uniref:Uncharacterized protein n=1 Tax=Candidatus Giovannonibacteria bacterium RIFCSPHIGHO2_02_FULL_45_40 TaxID=1798337 RepID=A0A1F5WBR6_9BACT|nr:MAG: hypothetical protein UV62_C0019G0005 [Parcubacteria group bacterium GW2011_GWC1_43_11]OGF49789.1 MAG: hypothetical protein A2120_04080 [Candidatus Giovannonibacteria bacterium GWA2_45_15]OGF59514.1 MAG: hypothetical protein A2W40_02710 [Candidatus Giovannonibacteria bacterium RIFCSPHIGHO2_01_45_12]OGF60500.1 MAG: hypothetical protein A2656_00245 [Candidatus Giovannonibacteria bacterium RIFCSPHIGHO2_01_FULL_44_100]OGF72741.1 MAG: hypothetical protein A3C05_03160 [Candidatus Giovannonibac
MEENANKSLWRSKWLWIAVLVLILAVLFAGWWKGWEAVFAKNTYQAVFLTNSQVYFGRLSDARSSYPVLTDIFYLQVAQPLQAGNPPAGGQVQLVKLGNELHGPKDEMRINRDHILFVEDLKPDSQVVKAIESFKANTK